MRSARKRNFDDDDLDDDDLDDDDFDLADKFYDDNFEISDLYKITVTGPPTTYTLVIMFHLI